MAMMGLLLVAGAVSPASWSVGRESPPPPTFASASSAGSGWVLFLLEESLENEAFFSVGEMFGHRSLNMHTVSSVYSTLLHSLTLI